MEALVNILLSTIAVLVAANILPGVHVNNFWTALILAVVMGIINGFIAPILFILTLPITILTLGLFSLVIIALMVMLASAIVPGFQIDGFWYAMLFGIVLAMINSLCILWQMNCEKLELHHQALLDNSLVSLGMEFSDYTFANTYLFRKVHHMKWFFLPSSFKRKNKRGQSFALPVVPLEKYSLEELLQPLEQVDFWYAIPEKWLSLFPVHIFLLPF